MNGSELINVEDIRNRIYTIRGVQVMLDEDLALLYGVETKVLNQAVKRNSERFPEEFMFQINNDEISHLKSKIGFSEKDSLRSQNVTLDSARGKHRKYLPYAFTEQGVAMLSAVLRSDTAIKVSIQIINAFVTMRRFIAANALIFQRLDTKQGIFFDGQIFDAYKFVADLIRTAQKSISNQMVLDVKKYNEQYPAIEMLARLEGMKA